MKDRVLFALVANDRVFLVLNFPEVIDIYHVIKWHDNYLRLMSKTKTNEKK